MPLSTGLLVYYFPPEERARLMGLFAAMNQMGGVVAFIVGMVFGGVMHRFRQSVKYFAPVFVSSIVVPPALLSCVFNFLK